MLWKKTEKQIRNKKIKKKKKITVHLGGFIIDKLRNLPIRSGKILGELKCVEGYPNG